MPNNKKQSTGQGNKEHSQKTQSHQGGYGNTNRQAGSGEPGGYVDVSGSQDHKTLGKSSGMNKDDEDEM